MGSFSGTGRPGVASAYLGYGVARGRGRAAAVRRIAACLAVATVALVVALAGCGGSSSTGAHSSNAPTTAGQGAPAGGSTCIFGANGVDVQVELTNQDGCSADLSALAGDGLNWYPIARLAAPGSAGSADQETMSQTCQLSKGSSTMTVMDAGGATYGDQICSSEEQDGWTPAALSSQGAPSGATPSGASTLPAGVTAGPDPGTYYVNCSVAQCTTVPGAGPFGTTCSEPSTGMQLCH